MRGNGAALTNPGQASNRFSKLAAKLIPMYAWQITTCTYTKNDIATFKQGLYKTSHQLP